jgi:chemotaxis-related protein WspD
MSDTPGSGLAYSADAVASGGMPIDTCWKTIGVRGDNSCPRLEQYIRCLNCPVFSNAATVLLDRYALQREPSELVYPPRAQVLPSRSLMVFRIAGEWLALATHCLVEVAPSQAVHSVPHQRSRTLLGVANVRGTLAPCIGLHELLGIEETLGGAAPGAVGRAVPRMLILAAQGGAVVAPVDEVEGVRRYEEQLIEAGRREPGSHFTAAVIQEGPRRLRVLDEPALMAAITRSLT